MEQLTLELAPEGYSACPLPSFQSAERCQNFLKINQIDSHIHPDPVHSAAVLLYPADSLGVVKKFWQHTGSIISSRWAASALNSTTASRDSEDSLSLSNSKPLQQIRERLAGVYEVDPDYVWVFPTGMAAIYEVALALQRLYPGRPFAQVGFPYVDSWKVQSILNRNSELYPSLKELPGKRMFKRIQQGDFCGVFMEMPSNPLLEVPDLLHFQSITNESETPLIIDDTLANAANVDLLNHADAVTCSLTKYFSGSGDVMAGGLIISPRRFLGGKLQGILKNSSKNLLWPEDAYELERNSRDFILRVNQSFNTAQWLVDALTGHPKIEKIHYPTTNGHADRLAYFHRENGPKGFGALFSIELKQPEIMAPKFFDNLTFNKGPNLGSRFSLCCPYTLLAHYKELDFAEASGVSRWLIRFSIGLEPREELLGRIHQALGQAAS